MIELASQQKRKQLLAMLDAGLVMLHLDPRRQGVVVPNQYVDDPVLRLNIAYGFRLPQLVIDTEGVLAVLSFNKRDFACTLPWDAIFAMTAPNDDHEGMVWPESVPDELAPFFNEAGVTTGAVPVSLRPSKASPVLDPSTTTAPDPTPEPGPRPLFIVHEGGGAQHTAQPEDEDGGDAADAGNKGRPTLTIVKG